MLYSRYFQPPDWMNILLNSKFSEYTAALSHSRHHVLSYPIKEHNRRRSACHGRVCLHVGQSVYSSASCRAGRSSSTYLQIFKSTSGRSSYSIARMHAHTHAHTHMHRQLTLPKEKKHSRFKATVNKSSRLNDSKGLHLHTYRSLWIHSTSKPSRTAH